MFINVINILPRCIIIATCCQQLTKSTTLISMRCCWKYTLKIGRLRLCTRL